MSVISKMALGIDQIIGREKPGFNRKRALLGILPVLILFVVAGYFYFFNETAASDTTSDPTVFDGRIPDAKRNDIADDKDQARLKVIPEDTATIPLLDVPAVAENETTIRRNLQEDGQQDIQNAFANIDASYTKTVTQSQGNKATVQRSNHEEKFRFSDEEDSILTAAGLVTPKNRKFATVIQDQVTQPVSSGTAFQPVKKNMVSEKSNSEESVEGVIINNYKINSGGKVTIRILRNVTINSIDIPRNTTVTGMATLNGNRLLISIPGSKINGQLQNILFKTYDLDGIEGIEIEGLTNQELKNNATNDAIDDASSAITSDNRMIGTIVKTVKTFSNKRNGTDLYIVGGTKVILRYAAN